MRDRPVVLLSRDEAYTKRLSATIAPITTRKRSIPAEVPVGRDEGLPRPSVINVDDISTIPLASLDRLLGEISSKKMREVEEAIRFVLDLPRFAA